MLKSKKKEKVGEKKVEHDCFSRVHFLAHFRFCEGLFLFSCFCLGVCLVGEAKPSHLYIPSTRLNAKLIKRMYLLKTDLEI